MELILSVVNGRACVVVGAFVGPEIKNPPMKLEVSLCRIVVIYDKRLENHGKIFCEILMHLKVNELRFN